MPAIEAYAVLPRATLLARLARGPEDVVALVRDREASVLARRPDGRNWAPVEIVCHLRDNEESFLDRLRLILLMDDPCFVSTNPNRWAEERQYLRQEAIHAAGAFARRRAEALAFLDGLGPGDWSRAGVHRDSRGRRTVGDFVSVMAWHDDNHLDQLRRALDGRA